MDDEDLILMANFSGLMVYGLGKDRARFIHHLKSFANLAAHMERTACANLCEEQKRGSLFHDKAVVQCSYAIRARGQE